MKTLNHYTLNTGHTYQSPRSEVGDDVVAAIKEWIADDEFNLPFDGHHVTLSKGDEGGVLATVFNLRQPLVTMAVAGDQGIADELWPIVERFYHTITDQPGHRSIDWQVAKRPEPPWLTVVIVSPLAMPPWLADFERCLAWAWLERNNND